MQRRYGRYLTKLFTERLDVFILSAQADKAFLAEYLEWLLPESDRRGKEYHRWPGACLDERETWGLTHWELDDSLWPPPNHVYSNVWRYECRHRKESETTPNTLS